jgi:hypothetical protein
MTSDLLPACRGAGWGVCHLPAHLSRRSLLAAALGLSGIPWLTRLAEHLARADERVPQRRPRSLIILWMSGGPSQLETFDPHPGSRGAHPSTRAIPTAAREVHIADALPQVAEVMDQIALVRSVVSKEGDHERAAYNMKTGFRPDPTLVHPALGAILCHQLSDDVEIPRHISILPDPFPARGGYLGGKYDAFQTYDPAQPIPDVRPPVDARRADRRLQDLLTVVEPAFAQRRRADLPLRTLHTPSIQAARRMMSSEQLKALDVSQAPQALKAAFGDTPFGRGCLAAVQLVEVGVRCVEVNLSGWDTHANNETQTRERCATLDPALASLIRELKARDLLQTTLVLWAGEFGRTPRVNPAGGRDHWPHGFTVALAGGGIAGGRVVGETSPEADPQAADKLRFVHDPRPVEDLHATILHLMGVDYRQELRTPIGRPMRLSEGTVIRELLAS